ncbi:MAG: hypothetical protein WC997_05855 [Porticoccaceae bacterium]
MKKGQLFSLPWTLVALDVVGAVLAARGIYLYVSESRGTFHILAGLLLMLPLVLHLINPGPRAGGPQQE